MKKNLFSIMACLPLLMPLACKPETPVTPPDPTEDYVWIEPNIERTGTHVAELRQETDGSWTITLPDNDPYIYFFPFEQDLPAENTVIAFEYQAENPIDKTQCFFLDAVDGLNAAHAQDGPGAAAAGEWTPWSVRMKNSMIEFDWGEAGYIRLPRNEGNACGIATRAVVAYC